MANNIATSLAALGIALAPALLKFAEAPKAAEVEVNEDAVTACVLKDKAPVHVRYLGTGDVEARLNADAVVQVLSKRKNWRHIAYVDDSQASLGWITDEYVGACAEHPDGESTTDQPNGEDTSGEDPSGDSVPAGGRLKIATFNIQNLGKTKMGKDEVVTQLVRIVKKYPLVAVQELSDKDNQVPGQFLDRINSAGIKYDMLVSERSGVQDDDKKSQEQYAFYFDKTVLEAKSRGELYDDKRDFFQREPYVARFKVKSTSFDFVIVTIHTTPEVIGEIEHLDDVVVWARDKFPGETDFIVLGDYNAGCSYVSPEELDELSLRNPDEYTWIVDDKADTNLATKACAYDRIVVTPSMAKRFLRWGVDRAFTDKAVSDHWPVWAEFKR